MSNRKIVVFQTSTDEDMRWRITILGTEYAERDFVVYVRERGSNLQKVKLELGSGLTRTVESDRVHIDARVARAAMATWARTEYETDITDESGGATRTVPIRVVYDEPGKLPGGIAGNQATVSIENNQAIVVAIGGVGLPGPANSLTIGDIDTLEAGEPATASITGTAPNQFLNLGLPEGGKGDKGWAPVFGLAADGERFVFVLAGWSGGEGPPPPTTSGGLPVYVGPAGFTTTIGDAFDTRGKTGLKGDRGDKGWAPLLVAVPDGARRVLRVADWLGGEGGKPPTGAYLGDGALVTDIADAVDFRGPPGSVVAPGSIDTADLADGILSADTEGRGKMADGFVSTDKVEDKAITLEKQADVASGVMMGRASAGSGPQEPLIPAQIRALAQIDRFNRPRSRIINGSIRFNQRVAGTVNTSGSFPCDRFILLKSGSGVLTATQSSGRSPGGSSKYLYMEVTTADAAPATNNYYIVRQNIEGFRIQDAFLGSSSARPIIIYFVVNSNVSGTWPIQLSNADGTQTWVGSYTVSVGEVGINTVKSLIVPARAVGTWLIDSGVGLVLNFIFGSGSNWSGSLGWQASNKFTAPGLSNFMASTTNKMAIMDIALYVDTDGNGIVPPYILPLYEDENAECMRFYSTAQVARDGYLGVALSYDTVTKSISPPMRATPSLTNLAFSGGNLNSYSYDTISPNGYRVVAQCGGVGSFNYAVSLALNAEY
jgi:hypothetical protein